MKYTEKQLHIMRQALEVFSVKGYDSTSVREIAQAANVNLSMISYYFGSKEKLLEAIFDNHLTAMATKIAGIVQSKATDAYQKIDLMLDTYIDTIRENSGFHKLMMREQVMLKGGALFASIREMKSKNRKMIEQAIKAGQKAGLFQKNVETPMLVGSMFGTVNYVFSNREMLCEQYDIDPEDNQLFYGIVIERMKEHLKVMFKSYLTYGLS